MNSSSSTSSNSLQIPGVNPNTPRHSLRQRSPKGQRGRSRKISSSNPPPPPRSIAALERIRNSPWFYPALAAFGVVVLGLLYSAIRISTHTADYYPPHSTPAPIRTAKKPRIGRPGAKDAPPVLQRPQHPTSEKEGIKRVKVGEGELDEAIRSALENTWHLSGSVSTNEGGTAQTGDGGIDESILKDREANGEGQTRKQRSLAELYEELDGLGISVDELNEVMQGAIGNL